MSINAFSRLTVSSLVLGGLLAAGPAVGADPCPWQGAENSVACAKWELMSHRLEAAEARAAAAENALQSMEQALQSMEKALQGMAAQPAPNTAMPAPAVTEQAATDQTTTEQAASTAPVSAGEQQARALIDKAIMQLEQSLSYEPGRLLIDKNYTLQAEGNGYRAMFSEFALEFEDIRIDASPASLYLEAQDADRTQVALKLSDSIRIMEGDDLMTTITIGQQTLMGVWSEQIHNMPEFQLDLANINVSVTDDPGTLSIARVAATQALDIAPDDQWQQAQQILISSIQFDSGAGESFTLAELAGEIRANGQQYSKLITMSEDIQKLVEDNIDAQQDPEAILDYVGSILALFEGYQFNFVAKGLDVRGGGASLTSIGTINVVNNLSSQGDNGGSFGLTIELDQLGSQMAPLPPDLLPHQIRMQLALDNIPPNLLQHFVEVGMNSESIPEEQQDMYWQQQMLGMLMNSQLSLRVIDTYVAADSARADLNLRAAVDPGSAMGGTGELNLRIAGMQTLIDMTGAQQNESAAPVLAMITAFSNRTEENGTTVDTFDLRFSPEGKLFLNGKDVTAMFMPGAAPQ